MRNMSRFPQVVADIGGTNARFALVTEEKADSGEFVIVDQKNYDCATFETFELLLQTYFDSLDTIRPRHVCVALAGPVDGDEFKMTNLNRRFSRSGVKAYFDLENFEVINDFAAQACSVTHLQPRDLIQVKQGEARPLAAKAIIGPGTGLGVASLIYNGSIWQPQAGEGGHANFAPSNLQEISLLQALMQEFEHVSLETLLCGRGLVTLYRTLCSMQNKVPEDYEPAQVSELGASNKDELCRESLALFCRILGSAAGNLALTCGAKGGVYLAGGILPRIKDFLLDSGFAQSFQSKGVMSPYVEGIPVFLMVNDSPALIGAAAWLEDHAFGSVDH